MERIVGRLRPHRLRSLWFFSSRGEDSHRLRTLVLVSVWLAALALAWVGGSLWLSILAGTLGTAGHWLSWHWRHRPSRARPVLIALSVIVLSLLMRSQMLEVFHGNWIPLAQFLMLVLAFSSFDLRTRAGLYTSLALSGIVIFFASQQAFNPSFGVFVSGFVAVLLAFLTLAFLEDGMRNAQVHWTRRRSVFLAYLIGTCCAVLFLSGLAFWLMPRGDSGLIGPAQVLILPYSSNSFNGGSAVPDIDLAAVLPITPSAPDEDDNLGDRSGDTPSTSSDGRPESATQLSTVASGASDGKVSGRPTPGREASVPVPPIAFTGNTSWGGDDQVVFYVKSKVASYWQGRQLEHFDGRYWRTDTPPYDLARKYNGSAVWYNRESAGLDNTVLYHQAFYVAQDVEDSLFMGHRGLRVFADQDVLGVRGLRRGDSYRVVSAQPQNSPERLRREYSPALTSEFAALPPGSERLRSLANGITKGAGNDFDKAGRIVGYLAREGKPAPRQPGGLASLATLDEFLFEGQPGSALEYATATVMLARASGLTARLALGYLPGIRDPLSAAFVVRESDAHAWAEILFTGSGWVPFDSAPHSGIFGFGGTDSKLGSLFQAGIGESVYGSAKAGSSGLFETLKDLLGHRVFYVACLLLAWVTLLLRLLAIRSKMRRGTGSVVRPKYFSLPGEERRELLKLYSQVEKLLRQKARLRRQPWQTVGDYSSMAVAWMPERRRELAWFAQAARQAAYNPGDLPAGLVADAHTYLKQLKAGLSHTGLSVKGKATPASSG